MAHADAEARWFGKQEPGPQHPAERDRRRACATGPGAGHATADGGPDTGGSPRDAPASLDAGGSASRRDAERRRWWWSERTGRRFSAAAADATGDEHR